MKSTSLGPARTRRTLVLAGLGSFTGTDADWPLDVPSASVAFFGCKLPCRLAAADSDEAEDPNDETGPRPPPEAIQKVNMSTVATAAKVTLRGGLCQVTSFAPCTILVASKAGCLTTGHSRTAAKAVPQCS